VCVACTAIGIDLIAMASVGSAARSRLTRLPQYCRECVACASSHSVRPARSESTLKAWRCCVLTVGPDCKPIYTPKEV